MRNPFRTEAEAFSFTLVIAALGLAIVLAAIFGGGWVALGVFLALLLGVGAGIFLGGEPRVREPAVWARSSRDPARRRILVVANETVAGRALQEEIGRRASGGKTEVLVVAPALNSMIKHWTSDEDGARAGAQVRVDTSLAALADLRIDGQGRIGDADPIQAIEDALRSFRADEIILSTHPPGRSNWLERGVVERARELFPAIGITHVIVDLAEERAAVEAPDAAS